MVLRLRDPLALTDLHLAAQTALAPTLQSDLPAVWESSWVLTQPPAWDGGQWNPTVRAVTVHVVNAGPTDTLLTAIRTEGGWLQPSGLLEPLTLGGYGAAVEVTVPLDPKGLTPGLLTGALVLEGPGWCLPVPLRLYVPFGTQPWWEAPALALATHVQEHTLRLAALPGTGADARGELLFAGTPVAAPDPVWAGDHWEWPLTLTSGEYTCTLLVDGKAVELQAAAPHRWEWERAGRGRLTVGAASATTRVINVGDQPIEAHVESDAPWLEVTPGKVSLQPGEAAAVAVRDRLTHLEQGAVTGRVRVLALPDRKLWAELPVTRTITADMGMPVLAPAALVMSVVGRRAQGARLTVRNVGVQPLDVRLETPPLVEADWTGGTIAPGGARVLTLAPHNPDAGEKVAATGFVILHTNSQYPALQKLQVPVTVKRLYVVADPATVDLGEIAPGGSQYSPWLKLRLSDGSAGGQFTVEVPKKAAWLEYRHEKLVVRNRPLLGISGPVSTAVIVREISSGAETQVPVRAFLQRPRLQHSGDIRIRKARPGRKIRHVVRIWDEGQGLQVRGVRAMLPWLEVNRCPEGLELTIKTGKRERTLQGDFTVDTNDPDQPRVRIAVRVDVKPTRWDRLRLDLAEARLTWLLWAVPALLILIACGYFWWVWSHVPTEGGGGGGLPGHVDSAY